MVRTIRNIKTVNNQGGLQWKGRTGSWEDSVQLRLVLTKGRIRWSPRAYLLASAATGHRQLWNVCGCTLPVSGVIRCQLLVNHWYQCQNDCTVCVCTCVVLFFFASDWTNSFCRAQCAKFGDMEGHVTVDCVLVVPEFSFRKLFTRWICAKRPTVAGQQRKNRW